MSKYAYMLRYTLQPGHWEEERLEALVEFCRKGRIDDVMFFIEPLNLRHNTMVEVKPWIDMIGRAKIKLDRIGVTTSVNPLNTLLHDSAGNHLSPDLNFQLMVDPHGNQSSVAVCPLCPEWRSYIIEMYAYYATLQPYSLWVEDDFRFHNHAPLVWGGCFCDAHLSEFARQAGEASMDREKFVRGLLASGEPHEYRRIWLESCRQTMVQLAGSISDAVHRISPHTRIGLMTSMPSLHAAEGRDWHGVIAAFDGDRPAIVRPHLPAYRETSGMQYAWYFNEVSRLTAALLPEHTETFPELENVPYTSFSKSKSFQKYQLECSLLLGSKGITLNIIDMVGNGLYPEEQAERWLNEEKDFLNTVASMELKVDQMTGVQVLVNERSSYSLHTAVQHSMEALNPMETFWASLLSSYGIANKYVAEWPQKEGIIALSGQILRNYDEKQIRKLFAAHCILLEGDALYTLYEMGLGSLCGVKRAAWLELQSIEQIVNGREYSKTKEGRMRPYLSLGHCLDIQYEQGSAEVISHILNVQGEVICPGMTVVDERVFILPYGQKDPEGLLNPIRRAVLQETIDKMGDPKPLMVTSYSPQIAVYEFRSDNQQSITIINNSLDEADGIELAGADLTDENWKAFNRNIPMGQQLDLRSVQDRTAVNANFAPLTVTVLHRKMGS